ncbi:MAG: response regulator transcription factor [Solimonas sp.]
MKMSRHTRSSETVVNKRIPSHNALSPREMQALYLIVCGSSTREVAERLKISVHTAQHHKRCIYEKLSVRNSAQLMRDAFMEGWLRMPGARGDGLYAATPRPAKSPVAFGAGPLYSN